MESYCVTPLGRTEDLTSYREKRDGSRSEGHEKTSLSFDLCRLTTVAQSWTSMIAGMDSVHPSWAPPNDRSLLSNESPWERAPG